jgi:glycosyltransferase involved in cell wall biosynthesis
MQEPRYIVITPVRNEQEHLPKTIESMRAQTIRPAQWILVNDGSSDDTGRIIENAARALPWVEGVNRSDRGFRQAGGGVIDAFYDGYGRIGARAWDYLVKLDGDLSFEPGFFERCFAYFAAIPRLGIGGGTICQSEDGKLVTESSVDPSFHVRGATKIYRAACWQEIGGLIHAPGWDTVDEFKANMLGWQTRTFPEIKLTHHRHAGEAYGQWHNWTKNGLANYVAGYHPLFMLAKCFKRAFHKPRLVVATGLWLGYCSGYWKRVPQAPDRDVVRYVRKQQLRRMLLQRSIYS